MEASDIVFYPNWRRSKKELIPPLGLAGGVHRQLHLLFNYTYYCFMMHGM